MDVVDIFLLWVVGFSVVLFLIVDSYEASRKSCLESDQSSASNDSESKTRTWSESVKASDDQEDEKHSVFQEIREEEDAENPVNARSERSGICSGNLDDSDNIKIEFCSNMGVSEFDEKETFDDWEGIERTELEKTFGEAVVFVSDKSNADRIDGEVKMKLYGLQKVALEGPCHGSQPMALKVSARAKWNAWQKLGNMSREMAMEKYINILVKAIPEWKGEGTVAVEYVRTSED